MKKTTNYFYIDETGHINNDSGIFALGCIKTQNPTILSSRIEEIAKEIKSSIYFHENKDKFIKYGFHAVKNNRDIRAKFYAILPLLDYRFYFVILDKRDDFFSRLKEEKNEGEIYTYCLKKLLSDRIIKCKQDKNVFIFENLPLKGTSLKKILKEYFNSFNDIDIEYKVENKSEINLSLIDYLNYIF